MVGLRSDCNFLIHELYQRNGVWRRKHYFDVVIKITNKRGLSESIVNNKQYLERSAILQTALIHFIGTGIQEGILEEELDTSHGCS